MDRAAGFYPVRCEFESRLAHHFIFDYIKTDFRFSVFEDMADAVITNTTNGMIAVFSMLYGVRIKEAWDMLLTSDCDSAAHLREVLSDYIGTDYIEGLFF